MNKLYFSGPNPTCDLIVQNHLGQFLLIQRSDKAEACPNQWALPGGFIDTSAKKGEYWAEGTETPKEAAVRELAEETNLKLPEDIEIVFVGKFEGNNRDPRDTEYGWTSSFAFYASIPESVFNEQKDSIRGLDDASNAKWFSLEDIKELDIAFDHSKILHLAESLDLFTKKSVKNKP